MARNLTKVVQGSACISAALVLHTKPQRWGNDLPSLEFEGAVLSIAPKVRQHTRSSTRYLAALNETSEGNVLRGDDDGSLHLLHVASIQSPSDTGSKTASFYARMINFIRNTPVSAPKSIKRQNKEFLYNILGGFGLKKSEIKKLYTEEPLQELLSIPCQDWAENYALQKPAFDDIREEISAVWQKREIDAWKKPLLMAVMYYNLFEDARLDGLKERACLCCILMLIQLQKAAKETKKPEIAFIKAIKRESAKLPATASMESLPTEHRVPFGSRTDFVRQAANFVRD